MICTKQVASLLKLRRRYGPGQDRGGIGPDKIHVQPPVHIIIIIIMIIIIIIIIIIYDLYAQHLLYIKHTTVKIGFYGGWLWHLYYIYNYNNYIYNYIYMRSIILSETVPYCGMYNVHVIVNNNFFIINYNILVYAHALNTHGSHTKTHTYTPM